MVGAFAVVPDHEGVKVGLYLLQRLIEFLSEGYCVKLVLDGLLELLDAPIGLRMPWLRLRVLNAV